MAAPQGYRKLPDGVRCRCMNLWAEADGSHWCCKPRSKAIETIIPSELGGDELWNRNGEYVSAYDYDIAARRIEDLEIALRAALSFAQERHSDPNDGHAVMVIAAMRGALRKDRD